MSTNNPPIERLRKENKILKEDNLNLYASLQAYRKICLELAIQPTLLTPDKHEELMNLLTEDGVVVAVAEAKEAA